MRLFWTGKEPRTGNFWGAKEPALLNEKPVTKSLRPHYTAVPRLARAAATAMEKSRERRRSYLVA